MSEILLTEEQLKWLEKIKSGRYLVFIEYETGNSVLRESTFTEVNSLVDLWLSGMSRIVLVKTFAQIDT